MQTECFIVGGGPSLKDFNWTRLDGKFVFAVNRSYEVLPDAQVVYFTDNDFWERHKDAMLAHKGKKIKGSMFNAKIEHPDVQEYIIAGPKGIEKQEGHIRHGNNSVYGAINVAYHMGFKKVYLLGVDMKWGQTGNRGTSHWHSGHKRIDPEIGYEHMIDAFKVLPDQLTEVGMEVINVVGPAGSNLQVFPTQTFDQVLPQQQLLGDHVERVLEKVGIAKAAKVYQRITKKPCNCGKRKQVLNNLHQKMIGKKTP